MTQVAVIDDREITITPVFRTVQIENVPKSERAGHLVSEARDIVEVRFAGSRNYSPTFPADAFSHRDPANANRIITYAERWPEQYRAFKNGDHQVAQGTPLEMLLSRGVTREQISLCRTLKIYSIEALNGLEGPGVKSLGMSANKLKDAARSFMADRMSAAGAMSEIEALRAEIAALKAAGASKIPAKEASPEEIEAAVKKADDAYAGMSDKDIKDRIKELAGSAPRGNPSRETLTSMLSELEAA